MYKCTDDIAARTHRTSKVLHAVLQIAKIDIWVTLVTKQWNDKKTFLEDYALKNIFLSVNDEMKNKPESDNFNINCILRNQNVVLEW